MPAAYSQDFRKKVITYVNKGNNFHHASLKFEIASNTVRNGYKTDGHYSARKVGGKKRSLTHEEITAYVTPHPGFSHGNTFRYELKKLGFSYKKTFSSLESRKKSAI